MLRPGSFFSRSASLAVVGLASLRRASTICVVPVGEVHLVPLASLAGSAPVLSVCRAARRCRRSVMIFQPAFSCRASGGVGQDAALLRVEHAGLLGAAALLEFLDRGDHALADFARDRAVILPDPGEIRLQRQPLGLRHRIGGIGRGLQRRADRDGCHRLRLGAGGRGRRHLGEGGFAGKAPIAATIKVAESTDLMTNPKGNSQYERNMSDHCRFDRLCTSAWSATTAPGFRNWPEASEGSHCERSEAVRPIAAGGDGSLRSALLTMRAEGEE